MKTCDRLYLFLIVLFLAGCQPGVATPVVDDVASPDAVATSLATVDPTEHLHLFDYDRDAPLDIQEDRRWEQANGTWIDFTYASPYGGRVPARLVIPNGRGPFPGMILMHGGPGKLEDMEGFAQAFCEYGAVSIMITSPYRRPGGWEITPYMGNTWPIFNEKDLRIKIQLIQDLQRAVDILLEQPQVDPDRLAYFGVSWGAAMGGLLAGVEDRLDAYILTVGDGGLVEHSADPGEDGINIHFSESWAAMMWPTEPLHYVGLAAPAALLFQNGIHDGFVPPRDAIRFYTAASEPKTMIWYDAGHNLPWSFVEDAANWLQPYLGDRLLLLSPNYHPYAYLLDRAIMALIAVPLILFLWVSFREGSSNWGDRLIWAIGIIFLGPIGLLLYWVTSRSDSHSTKPDSHLPYWLKVLEITCIFTIAIASGVRLGGIINNYMEGMDFRLRFLQPYVTMLILGWILTRFTTSKYRTAVFSLLLVLNFLWVFVMVVPAFLPYLYYTSHWWLKPAEVLLWMIITYPLHYGLTKLDPALTQLYQTRVRALPRMAKAVLLTMSFLAALGSVVWVIQLFTDLPWKNVVLMILGINSG